MRGVQRNSVILGVVLVLSAGLLTWAVVGTTAASGDQSACDLFFDSHPTFYEVGKVTLDQGMKNAARRAQRAARVADDRVLRRAFTDFVAEAKGHTWSDPNDPRVNLVLTPLLTLCSGPRDRY